MIWEAWFTLLVICLCLGVLIFTRWAADVVLMGGLTLLLVFGVLSPEQALAGLSNEGMVTVAVLFIVSAALKETGAIHWVSDKLLGRPDNLSQAQIRVMLPVAVLSAFLNNTPVVAMMIPAVSDWAKKFKLSVSKLMMPLSYAAIVGGTCTLIGTSTNLVVNGMLISEKGEGLTMFALAWVGIPCVVVTFIYVLLSSRWLLPERRAAMSQFADARQYTIEMIVDAGSPLIGKSIEEAGLRQLPGMYLIEIERGEHIIPAVTPQERLSGNDRLVFAGVIDSVVDLQKIRGLSPATNQVFKLNAPRPERCLIEVVISDTNPLVGKSIREGRFRSQYNAAVIAVARNGEQLKVKLGDVVLQAGDTLLLESHPSFHEQYRASRDFFLVARLENSTPPRHERAGLSLMILVAMVLAVAVAGVSMLTAAMVAAGAMIMSRCITGGAARRSIDLHILVVIASAFGIGQAMYHTGAAGVLADALMSTVAGHPLFALSMVFAVTALLTSLITNNAAAVLMFPVVLALAESMGASYMPFVITVMIAASASFATPIGYQTNLMVLGPGGYHFSDYFRLGGPLTILIGIVTVALVPLVWPF